MAANTWLRPRPLVMAHRGHRTAYPEQTLPAFAAAIELGCRAIEADVQLTRDGQLVMMHDLTLERTTDGAGLVADATLDELRRLDAGAWFAPRFAGTRVPTLDELLDLAMANDVTLCLEAKGTTATASPTAIGIAERLRAQGLVDRMFLSSFDHGALAAARRVVDGLLLAPERLPDDAPPDPDRAIRQARTLGATVLQHRWEFLTTDVVDELHAADVAVWAWPTDTPESIEMSFQCGVDGVIGDDVEWLLEVVETAAGAAAT